MRKGETWEGLIVSAKYQIGQTYLLKVFSEPEEMEYLGEIKTRQLNGSKASVSFEAFRRQSFGQPDLIALHNGEFFVRSYKNCVEDLVTEVGKNFTFVGKGYERIAVGSTSLSIEEFRKQVADLLTDAQIEEVVSKGRFYSHGSNKGEIKWCPGCKQIRQTSCSACGCGSCANCGYRWTCMPANLDLSAFKGIAGKEVLTFAEENSGQIKFGCFPPV